MKRPFRGGRPRAFKAGDITAARALMKAGKLPVRDVAKRMGVSVPPCIATSASGAPTTMPRMADCAKRPPGEALVDLRRRLALLSPRDRPVPR